VAAHQERPARHANELGITVEQAFFRLAADGNDDFAARVAGGNVSYRVRGFFQRVASIEDRGYGAGFNHFPNHIQVADIHVAYLS
jgi:hypothetical protein